MGYYAEMSDTTPEPILWYFADPMCSWCWGFSPVISRIKTEFVGDLNIALNLGGLRPGTTEPISGSQRDDILHHWRDVQRMTGQLFRFDGAMPPGFIYDTEPPSRAVLAFAELDADETLAYFTAIQSAFYTEGRDVTQTDVLAELAVAFPVDRDRFIELFTSQELRERTGRHFLRARRAGIRGFPSMVWQVGDIIELLAGGYISYEELSAAITERLSQT